MLSKIPAKPLIAAALIAGTLASSLHAGPVLDPPLYDARFAALIRDKGVFAAYDPLEQIRGAEPVRPLPLAPSALRSIKADALDQATAYAAANRSTAFLVWRNGALQAQSYSGQTTAATPLNSKSLAKPLSAIALGRAIALGKIKSLDQPVADYISEWKGTDKAAIRIRHLLDMRSGLMEQTVSTDPDHPINRAYIDPDHGWHLINNYPLVAAPGSKYLYSNATTELVAIVIERATGMRYAEFLGREILAPIGAAGGNLWLDRPGGLAHSGCCMHLPAESWLRLGILLLDDGVVKGRRLLPKGFADAMMTGTAQNPWYGLGVWIAGKYTERRGFSGVGGAGPQVLYSEPYLDRDLALFDGNSDQVVYISRATRMVILRMGETPPKSPEWDNTRLPNLLISGIRYKPGERRPIPQAR